MKITMTSVLAGSIALAFANTSAIADEIICPNVPVETMYCKDSKGNKWEVTCVGTNQDDTINTKPETDGPDVIAGLNGNDKINAGIGDDVVCGGNGDDEIDGGSGDSILLGGNGNDTLYGSPSKLDIDYLEGGNGDDTLMSKPGDDNLSGDRGDDFLGGGPGNDIMSGGPGDDFLGAGPGEDTLNCGTGNDTYMLQGGKPSPGDSINPDCETLGHPPQH